MLKRLSIENFRNYQKYSLTFNKITIMLGPNGIGKTNIIEAIYLLSAGRSWRTNKDSEVIYWQEELTKIKADISEKKDRSLEMIIQRNSVTSFPQTKIVKINGVKKKLTSLFGHLMVVLFSPEEIQLIDGSPSCRRRMLDILLCQVDNVYTLALLDYARIIRSRNKLLFYIKIGRSKINELDFWDEKLITLGSFIIKKRLKTIEAFNEKLTKIYQTVSGTGESLKIKYCPKVSIEDFKNQIMIGRQKEIERCTTLFGPHRDDLIFLLEGKDIVTFGSRGEYRSTVLALKVAELNFLEETSNKKPLLLLDDIFSELDKNRRKHLANIVSDVQTIITTTDLDHIEKGLRTQAKIIE